MSRATVALFLAAIGWSVLQDRPAQAQSVGASGCKAQCGGGSSPSSSSSGGSTFVPSGPTPEQREAKRRRVQQQQMLDTNGKGVRHYEAGEFELAVEAHREALALCVRESDCNVIRQNIANAQAEIDRKRTEEEGQRMEDAAAAGLNQDLNNLLSQSNSGTLDSLLPSAGGSGAITIDDAFGESSASGPLEITPVETISRRIAEEQERIRNERERQRAKKLVLKNKAAKRSIEDLKTEKEWREESANEDQASSNKIAEGVKKGAQKAKDRIAKTKESLKKWTLSEAYQQTIGKLPRAYRRVVKNAKELSKDLQSMYKRIFSKGIEGAKEGSKRVASPDGDGGYAEKYNKDLGALGDETEKKSKEMLKKSLKE